MKISLSNIKIAIFDFDDTLAIHKDKDYIKHRNENEESLLSYYLDAYLNPEKFYGNDIEVISTRNQELKIDAAKIIID